MIIAPSGGLVHPSGRAYVLVAGGLETIVALSAGERDSLWDLARSFDAMPRLAAEARPTAGPPTAGLKPGEAFERAVTWAEILGEAGWTHVYDRGETAHWRRPDKPIGVSATTNHGGSGLLYVFTSSTPFDSEKSYTKFGAFAVLQHGGDHAAAAAALRTRGYGDAPSASNRGETARTGPGKIESDTNPEWQPPRLSEVPHAPPFPVRRPAPAGRVVRPVDRRIGGVPPGLRRSGLADRRRRGQSGDRPRS